MSNLSIRRRLCDNDDEFIKRLEEDLRNNEEEIKVLQSVKKRQVDLEAETTLMKKQLDEAAQKIITKDVKIVQLERVIEAIIMIGLVLLVIFVDMLASKSVCK